MKPEYNIFPRDIDVHLKSQKQVDALSISLKGKTTIEGDLFIGFGGARIHLDINEFIGDIIDLTPLSNITHVKGHVSIRMNDNIIHLTELHKLKFIAGDFSVLFNDRLVSINLPSLEHIGGNFRVGRNPHLLSLGNFSALKKIEGSFVVSYNKELITLDDIKNLTYIGYDKTFDSRNILSIEVKENPKLRDSNILKKFSEEEKYKVKGVVSIRDKNKYNIPVVNSSIDKPRNNRYDGYIFVKTQKDVDELEVTLKGIDTIDGSLNIGYSDFLYNCDITDLSPLRNIIYVKEEVTIRRTLNLKNLNGLNSLKMVGGDFIISNNALLNDVSLLDNLRIINGSIKTLRNPKLQR